MLIPVDQLEESENRFEEIRDSSFRDANADSPTELFIENVPKEIIEGNILGEQLNLEKRKEMLRVESAEPLEFAFERAIGENDSVYSNFVELIVNAKRKVGRILIKDGIKTVGKATGFLVGENLLLTNWHVFKTIESVGNSEVQFNYELDIHGNELNALSFKLDSQAFFHSSKELDYCLVAVNAVDIEGQIELSSLGYIFLDPTLGKLGPEKKESLNLIHHPNGDYMQLSIRENLFTRITPISVWYVSDTAPGSSGSPVFNDQWQIVALHHMGVAKKNANGEYIDKHEDVIPVINNKIDERKLVWIANEGIRISVILKDLLAKFPNNEIVERLRKNPADKTQSSDRKMETNLLSPTVTTNNSNMESNHLSNNVNISFPASLIEKNGILNISFNQGANPLNQEAGSPAISSALAVDELDFFELKKLEETTDFSICKGYQSTFLGNGLDVPIPLPQKKIMKFIAKITGTDSTILKYFHYSSIFHAVRMMPIISAVNIDGDPEKRKDETERRDNWLRDRRIGYDIQLDDAYYKLSGFNKGHMTRREDANWGFTPEEAKRNADLTCMYTNACPQVASLNQSNRRGLWGILEKVVLETGVFKERCKTARISVLNGPVFKKTDPVFRGIQVPMEFYKIVLWLTDNGNLKATAFKLSQLNLVTDIDFEQIDIDQNIQFKEFQCSIRSLHDSTGMDFSNLFQFDTFSAGIEEEVELQSEFELQQLFEQQKGA